MRSQNKSNSTVSPKNSEGCNETAAGTTQNLNQFRVAVFSGNYNYVRDGANQALNSLVRYLLERGAKVRVYSPTTDTPAFEPEGELVSAPSIRMFAGRDEYRLSTGITDQIKEDLDSFGPNIIHVSAPDILGHHALTYAQKNKIFSVASLHTRFETYPKHYNMGFVKPILVAILKRFYNRANALLLPVESMTELVRDWGVQAPVSVWSRGVDRFRFNPDRRSMEWRNSLGIHDDEVVVGFLGRLVFEKGLKTFASVHQRLLANNVSHRVLIVGDGPAKDWLAKKCGDAIFTGQKTGSELGRALASMDIFLNPSISEAFGNVTVEAMSSGLPVVAAKSFGASDHVRDLKTGFLIEPHDLDHYSRALSELIENKKLRTDFGNAGFELSKSYNWNSAHSAVVSVYRSFLKT